LDFVHDQLLRGRRFRILTVLDQWSREALVVEPRLSYSGVVVAQLLDVRPHSSLGFKPPSVFAREDLNMVNFLHPARTYSRGQLSWEAETATDKAV
jgi:hypothetical protein